VSEFLIDTKRTTGDLPPDPESDCDNYIRAIQKTQKRNVNFCSMVRDDQEVIGFVDVFPVNNKPEIGFIEFIYLIEKYRGKGIGKILMDFVYSVLKENNCRKIYLNVSEKNNQAIKFYKKYGFEFTGKKRTNHLQMCKVIYDQL
jgi:ribosomal protein S18 acetylase RimI-like enzyme